MGEYNGRINVSKDTMLFVVNSVFNQGIKENTTKENILKLKENTVKTKRTRAKQKIREILDIGGKNNG